MRCFQVWRVKPAQRCFKHVFCLTASRGQHMVAKRLSVLLNSIGDPSSYSSKPWSLQESGRRIIEGTFKSNQSQADCGAPGSPTPTCFTARLYEPINDVTVAVPIFYIQSMEKTNRISKWDPVSPHIPVRYTTTPPCHHVWRPEHEPLITKTPCDKQKHSGSVSVSLWHIETADWIASL